MSDKNARLGRGLESLIPTLEEAAPESVAAARAGHQSVTELPLGKIDPGANQPRREFDSAAIAELAASIKEHGVIQPVIVTAAAGRYELIAGERRVRAAREAGLTAIPAIVRTESEQQKLTIAIIENLQRADLNPMELCVAYTRLIEDFGLTQDQVAGKVGKSRSAVANCLRLAALPEEVQNGLLKGLISEGHARAILSAPPERRRAIYDQIIKGKLSVRAAEQLAASSAASPHSPKAKPSSGQISADESALLTRLRERLGAKVTLERAGKGGKLKIEFYSEEELDRIARKLLE